MDNVYNSVYKMGVKSNFWGQCKKNEKDGEKPKKTKKRVDLCSDIRHNRTSQQRTKRFRQKVKTLKDKAYMNIENKITTIKPVDS